MTRFQFNDPGFKTFGEIVNDIFNEVPNPVNHFYPKTNISESKDNFEIEMLVPGRSKEDFHIALDKNLLTISYDKKEEKSSEKNLVKKEFTLRSFSRSFTIDEKINIDDIQAKYENGILRLTLPKKEEVKISPKQISVQ